MTERFLKASSLVKMKLLLAWMEIHHDELEANWSLLERGEQFFRVDPLS